MSRQKSLQEDFRGISYFTILELLAVISIMVLLVSLLLPGLNKAREKAREMACANNLKQMNYCFLSYLNDNAEYYMGHNNDPVGAIWCYKLLTYVNTSIPSGSNSVYSGIFKCPADREPTHINIMNTTPDYMDVSYGYNAGYPNAASNQWYGLKMNKVRNPSLKVLVADSGLWYQIESASASSRVYRHRTGDNFLWADGHASWEPSTFPPPTYEYYRASY